MLSYSASECYVVLLLRDGLRRAPCGYASGVGRYPYCILDGVYVLHSVGCDAAKGEALPRNGLTLSCKARRLAMVSFSVA